MIKAEATRLVGRYRAMPVPVKAALWFTVCSIVQRGISVVSMPIFTRLMSTDEYGQYSLYMSWYSLLSIVVTLNLALEVFNKGLSDHGGDRDRYASTQLGLVTCVAFVLLLTYLALRRYVNAVTGLPTELMLVAFVEAYAGSVVNLWYARKRFDYSYRSIVAVTVAVSVLSVAFGVLFVCLCGEGERVFARAVSNAIPPAVAAVVCAVSFLRKSPRIFHSSWWKASLALAIPLLPHYISQVFLRQADTVMIGWFVDDTSVAIYSVAASAGLILVLVNNGINSSFVPWLYGKLNCGETASVVRATNSLCVVVLAVNAMLMLVAPECVALLAASEYAEAAWSIAPVAASVVSCFVCSLYVNVEVYCGKTFYASIASVVAAAAKVVLNLLLIPRLGYLVAAYTTAACYFLMAVMHYFFQRQALKGREGLGKVFDSRFMFSCCVGSILVAVVCLGLYWLPALRYAVIAVSVIAAWALKGKVESLFRMIKKG